MKNILTILFLLSAFCAFGGVDIKTSSTLPKGTNGVSYDIALKVSDGRAPYFWSLRSGTLPPGVTLSAGHLIGVPHALGNYTFKLRVRDARDDTDSQTFALTIKPAPAPQVPVPPVVSPPVVPPSGSNVVITPSAQPLPAGAFVAAPLISETRTSNGVLEKGDRWDIPNNSGTVLQLQNSGDGVTWRFHIFAPYVYGGGYVTSGVHAAWSRLAPPPTVFYRMVNWTAVPNRPPVEQLRNMIWQ